MLDGIYGASFFLSKLLDNKVCIDLQDHPLSAEDGTQGCDLTTEIQLSYSARLKSKIEYIKNNIITNNLADLQDHTVFIKKIAGFAGHVNELLSLLSESDDPTEKNERTVREAIRGVRMPERHTMPSKMVFTEMAGDLEEQVMRSGIKINNEGLLSIDEETLGRFLSSKGDEGVSVVKSFTNVFYDRILMYLGAGSLGIHVVNDYDSRYTVNNADTRIDTRLEEKRQELEKEMNVLQMLIDSSKVLKNELTKQLFAV